MAFAFLALAFFSACPEPENGTPDPVPTVIALDGKEIPLVSSDLSAGEVKAVIARIQAAYGAMSAGDKAVFAGKTVKTVNIAAENAFSITGTEITFSFTASAAEAEISGVFSNCAVQLAKCNCAEGTSRYQDEPACGGNNCQCAILTAPATANMGTEIAKGEEATADLQQFLASIRKYTEITELTPAILNEFISRIEVHAPEKAGGKRTQKIDIYYNAVGVIDIPTPEDKTDETLLHCGVGTAISGTLTTDIPAPTSKDVAARGHAGVGAILRGIIEIHPEGGGLIG